MIIVVDPEANKDFAINSNFNNMLIFVDILALAVTGKLFALENDEIFQKGKNGDIIKKQIGLFRSMNNSQDCKKCF